MSCSKSPCVITRPCFLQLKWFSSVGIRDLGDIRNNFSDAAGMLPGNLPMQALYTFDWRTRIAVPTSILRHPSPRGRSSLSLRFMEAVFARLEIPINDSLIPSCYHCDTWQCRTEDEQLYLENIIDCTFGDPVREADHICRNQRSVTNDAVFWTCSFLPSNFRRMKRGGIFLFQNTVCLERRLRSDTGYFIAYQMPEAPEISCQHYVNRYQRKPSWWSQYEVCQGFCAKLGPILTYYGSYLHDFHHGLWTVFLTDWCVKVAATLLWEVFDCWRL